MLSDLRESGAIEQDADLVIFLYRPEYYEILQDEDGNDTRGTAEVIIAKHRNGELTTVKTKFIGKLAKFANLDDNNYSFEASDLHQPQNEDAPQGNYKTLRSRMDESDETPF
jgi:replicative DNA helicase